MIYWSEVATALSRNLSTWNNFRERSGKFWIKSKIYRDAIVINHDEIPAHNTFNSLRQRLEPEGFVEIHRHFVSKNFAQDLSLFYVTTGWNKKGITGTISFLYDYTRLTFGEKLLGDQEKSQFGIKTSINRKTGISLGFGFGFRLNDEFDDD